jgi:cellulose biosynthesis protein BcsQ
LFQSRCANISRDAAARERKGVQAVAVEAVPYVVFVASHKGGTGRTTAALALAWLWGQAGPQVAFVEADQVEGGTAAHFAGGDWSGVRFVDGIGQREGVLDCDLVLIDGPLLGERAAQPLLRLADAVLLTCAAEPLGVRTLSAALQIVDQARQGNPGLSLLGVSVQHYDGSDPVHVQLRGLLWRRHGTYVLEPAVPYQAEVAEWSAHPDGPLPEGPAQQAFVRLAARLEPALGCVGAMAGFARAGKREAHSAVAPALEAINV